MSDFSEGHNLGILAGKRQEQERIINLLEEFGSKKRNFFGTVVARVIANVSIAVIKGENK